MEPAYNIDTNEHLPKPQWEVADILHLYIDDYRQRYPLPASHEKVVRDIMACRTDALGGHVEECDCCGARQNAYNSCRNRHCPKCQTSSKLRWLEARKAELLPVGYFHNVFTLPHLLNPIVLCNKKRMFDLLFHSTAHTLHEFGENKKNGLEGKLGFIAVLHTWNQRLMDHFHLHVLVPAGALASDPNRWAPSHPGFLFPVMALSKVFRGKFIEALQQDFDKGRLRFPGNTSSLENPAVFSDLIGQLWKSPWVVFSKKPFAGPEQVLDYLGRYTHRVAISNTRIRNVENGAVSFTYRDRRDGNKSKRMTLEASEFIRRFLLHVLPENFMRIRHYGFLANRSKKHNLRILRQLFDLPPHPVIIPETSIRELFLRLADIDVARCPFCRKGTMRPVPFENQPTPVSSNVASVPAPRLDSS
ncbi:MAG: IS91 family transposase [Deltaproteobacteria bacterium]|nr:IS91 family transposase [Deltaproteobacteria bacterium]